MSPLAVIHCFSTCANQAKKKKSHDKYFRIAFAILADSYEACSSNLFQSVIKFLCIPTQEKGLQIRYPPSSCWGLSRYKVLRSKNWTA